MRHHGRCRRTLPHWLFWLTLDLSLYSYLGCRSRSALLFNLSIYIGTHLMIVIFSRLVRSRKYCVGCKPCTVKGAAEAVQQLCYERQLPRRLYAMPGIFSYQYSSSNTPLVLWHSIACGGPVGTQGYRQKT